MIVIEKREGEGGREGGGGMERRMELKKCT
jgi:hypothetical protein